MPDRINRFPENHKKSIVSVWQIYTVVSRYLEALRRGDFSLVGIIGDHVRLWFEL